MDGGFAYLYIFIAVGFAWYLYPREKGGFKSWLDFAVRLCFATFWPITFFFAFWYVVTHD